MATYAADTKVTVASSRAEVENTLTRYGCTSFAYKWDKASSESAIQFTLHSRDVRLSVKLPPQVTNDFAKKAGVVTASREVQLEALGRQRWRCLALYVKAVCEAIENRVVSIDEAFLPFVVMPDGRTLGEHVTPQLEGFLRTGRLLEGPSK